MATTTKKSASKKGRAAPEAPATTEPARTTVVRGDGREVAVSVPVDPPAAQDATDATDANVGADAGNVAGGAPKGTRARGATSKAQQAGKGARAAEVEVLTEAEAKARGGMTEIVRTLKTRDSALKQARANGAPCFVIAHEDGRFSVARPSEPAQDEQPEAPAPKLDMVKAPGKALDALLAAGKRQRKAKAAAEAKAAKPAGKAAGKAPAPKAAKERKPKRMSALDAAAQVLAKAKEPMRAKELIEAMAKQGLWASPGGKTPEATLYAAMLREISKKGDAARFRKVDRGAFVHAEAK